VAWSQADPKTRQIIEQCVREAMRAGIAYLEGLGVVSRRGENGVLREKSKLLFAAFEHSTSRAQDPQLHIHTILLNIGVREDGSTGTLEPKPLFRHQVAAGTLFRAELAARLEASLGLRARKEGRAFELIGVPEGLIAYFSKRRAEIEAALSAKGLSGAKAAEVAALNTRQVKQSISREKLFAEWELVGRIYDWSAKELSSLVNATWPARDREAEIHGAANDAITMLTNRQSSFSRRELIQAVAQESQGRALGAKDSLEITGNILRSEGLVPLSEHRGEMHWTTKEVLVLERSVLTAAMALKQRETPVENASVLISRVIDKNPHLSDEQRAALHNLCGSQGGLCLVQGMAGTGKSTLFAAAREIWEAQGLTVFGTALSGKAARGLQETTAIQSHTLHRTLWQIQHEALPFGSAAVLVVDEAAMVGTRQLAEVFEACLKHGATLVLCGDPKQLQPIELGGVFSELLCRHRMSELTQIRRQREEWARQAVKDFAFGRADLALPAYEQRGMVKTHENAWSAIERLIADWKLEAISHDSTVILAGTMAEVSALNRRAQQERQEAGFLGRESVSNGGEAIFVGDRVLFTKNSMALGIMNGDVGTVENAGGDTLTVRVKDGGLVTVDVRTYDHVRLGYALTTHKAQGMTAEKAFVLTGGSMTDRELSYVQASRARGVTRWYVADDLPQVVQQMKRTHEKCAATSLAAAPELELTLNR
jgi:Ti-type conjugative transfer relaxase TraA